MMLEFEKILESKEELEKYDRTNPNMVVALLVHTFCNYDKDNKDKMFDMLQYLMGDFQPLSPLAKQNITDRMMQNDKYPYIGKSYFVGATPANDYTPSVPYKIEVKENPYTDVEEGFKRLLVKSGGADSDRIVTVRLAKDGNYYVWSDTYMALLADIRGKESSNPWA